jgi:hypothetical protein
MHICRGHFKDFTEKGLFGDQKMKGTFWWHSYVRGTPHRVMFKDYNISGPTNPRKE